MKKPGFFLPTSMALTTAAFVTLLVSACAPQPQGPTLIYEVDSKNVTDGQTVDMKELTKRVLWQVNRFESLACVGELDDRRIVVALFRKNDADKRRVERLLTQTGTLEFRILANIRDDKKVIDRALADPSKMQMLDSKGKLLAWWVPVKAGEEKGFANYPEIARRTRTQGERETTEVLVVKDIYDVTGAYLTHVDVGTDRKGQPCVYIAFNNTGGQLVARLTGDHLPDKLSDFAYRLGIILNGEVYSAPWIRGTIFDRAEINGSFTEQEVHDLVSVLNSRPLPARIRLVKEKDSP